MAHRPEAQQHRREVRERRQVARCADRTLGRNARIDVGVQQLDHRLDDLGTHAGISASEARDLQQQHQAHDLVGQQRTDAYAVREDQVALQQLQLVVGDVGLRELAETRVDAIHRLALRDDCRDRGGAARQARARVRRERERLAAVREAVEVVEGKAARREQHLLRQA
jgi:hypothetical protein